MALPIFLRYLSQGQRAMVLAKVGGPKTFISSTSVSFSPSLSLQKPLE